MPPEPSPVRQAPPAFDVQAFLKSAGMAPRTVRFATGASVFAQGGQANSVFYVQEGGVKLSVLSSAGKEAVVAMLGPGDFFGEGCLAGQPLRMGTANAVMRTALLRIPKRDMVRMLHEVRILRPIPRAHADAQHPNRRGPGRSALQFQ